MQLNSLIRMFFFLLLLLLLEAAYIRSHVAPANPNWKMWNIHQQSLKIIQPNLSTAEYTKIIDWALISPH